MEKEKLLKMKDKIQALIKLGDSEKALGNEGAAALIDDKVQELMKKYKLEESDFIAAHPEIKYEPLIGVSSIKNPFVRANARAYNSNDVKWAEFLAATIAEGYYCKATINTRSGELNFYGVDFDRDIAILMFQKISEMALENCNNEMEKAKQFVGKKGFDISTKKVVEYPKVWMGDDVFLNSFMYGYGMKLKSNYQKNQFDETGNRVNQNLFDRIDAFVNSTMHFRENTIVFQPFNINEDTVLIGERYGRFTATKKAGKVQKSANIQLSKNIKKVEDDRVGEVILIVDDSGSMKWNNKIQQAKDGVTDFAKDAIEKKFAIGLIKFGSNATSLVDSKLKLNGGFESAISQLNAQSGNTYLFPALTMAASKMKSYHRHKKVILIATDGEVHDAEQALNFANMLKASGIEIMTIGTQDANADFLSKLSSGNKTLQVGDADLRKGLKGMAGYLTA